MAIPHILITGASRGIGAATLQLIRPEQARVVGHASADRAGLIGVDLAEPGAGRALWARALEALDGRIDVLVNNAGVFEANSIDSTDAAWDAGWERGLRVNLTAAAELCREAVRHWLATGSGGRIVNVASRAGHRGDSPAHWHYAAAKAGMIGLTKTIARGYASDGIYAFAVAPGFTMTGMAEDYLASRGGDRLLADIPLGRVADADEVANAIIYLALFAPASMTGATLDINGASYVR
jgi:NAD(P)-dependent dehydrogenase (short-subunit alcohol dehydrogenase family)